MNDVLFVAASAVAAAVTRACTIWKNSDLFRQGFVGNSSIHFAIIRQLKINPRSKYIEQYVIRTEPMSYPTLFHRICSLFSLDLIESRPYVPNFVLFVLFVAGFAGYLLYVSNGVLHFPSTVPAVVSVITFLLLPGQYAFMGPSLAYYSLSERFLARMCVSAFFLTAFVASQFHDQVSFVLAVLASTAGMLSAIFARQAIFFVTPVMSLLLWNVVPLEALGLSVVLGLALSRGHFIRGMKHTILTWMMYASHTKKSAVIRANLVRFVSPADLRQARSWREILLYLIQFEPGRSMLYYPEISIGLLFAIGIAWLDVPVAGLGGWQLAAPIIAAVSIFLLTATEQFNHLGECYRYIEYTLYLFVPAVFGLVAIDHPALAIGALFLLAICNVPVLILIYGIYGKALKWPQMDELKQFVVDMQLPYGAVVFPVGMPVAGDVCARRSDVKSFWYQPGVISEEIFQDYIDMWPFLQRDGGALIERFGVTHAIVDKNYLQYLPGPCRLPRMKLVFESARFSGYARMAPDEAGAEAVMLMPPRPTSA